MKNSVLFLGNENSDWGNISAQNPIDQISLSLDDSPDLIVDFVKKYDGNFMAGFISYEYGAKQLGVPFHEIDGLPAIHFRAYESYEDFSVPPNYPTVEWAPFEPIIPRQEYESNFKKIKDLIRAGDFYQINYTHPLKSKTEATPENLFHALRLKKPGRSFCIF